MLAEIVLGRVGIFPIHQLADEADARLHGEAAELVLYGDEGLIAQVGEVGMVGTVIIVHPFTIDDGVGSQILSVRGIA